MTSILQAALQLLATFVVLQSCAAHHKRKCSEGEPIITQATQPVLHAEGPHWDVETQSLFFVDIEAEKVNRYDPATNQVTQATLEGGGVSIVIPVEGTKARKLVATRGHDVVVLSWNYENATFSNTTRSENITVIASVETSSRLSGNRWNDGKADAKGRLWAGTIGPEPVVGHVVPDQAAFYLLDPNSTETITEVQNVTNSNGLVWNKDNTLLYYIDTGTLQIDVFDFDLEHGLISNRRKVFNLPENNVPGFPDGMTIDNKGNLWIACFNGGRVINVDPRTGTLLRSVLMPATRVCSLMFGGPWLDTLYVATSRLGLTDEEHAQQPLAGSVFAVDCLGVSALAPAHNVIRNDIANE